MADYRIYVACLASYNSGTLHGAWIDCDDKDADEINAEIATILRASPFPNVMVTDPETGAEVASAEEWAIHDHEGFGKLVGEYTPIEDVATLAEGLGGDNSIGFRWLIEDFGMKPAEALGEAASVIVWEGDQGQSRERLLGDYAQEFTDETGGLEGVPEAFRNYIDWESMAHDWDLNGDIDTFDHDGTIYVICNPRDF